MDQTFHSLIHAAAKLDVDELLVVRKQLEMLLGKDFVKFSDDDKSTINKVVRSIFSLSELLMIDC